MATQLLNDPAAEVPAMMEATSEREIEGTGTEHGASAPGTATAPHSAREGAQLKNNCQHAPNSMGSPPTNSMGSTPDGTEREIEGQA